MNLKFLLKKLRFCLSVAVFFISFSSLSGQDDLNVTGTVTDETGKALPGVNVMVKGTTTGVITDLQGEYNIKVPSEESVLVFSFVGYLNEERVVGDQGVIDVTLSEDVQQLSEVVVIGYGAVKKSDLTGAVSSVNADEMQKVATTNIGEALQGRAAGVMVSKSSGKPGAGAEIKIRGINSINSTDPLWVVDGVKGAPIGSIDDVESISILKDAAASAIYGKDAANGVIIVTTKRGAENKTSFKFRAYNSWNITPEFPEPITSNQLAEARITALRNGEVPEETIQDQYGYYLQDFDVSTDWADELLRTGNLQYYYLSASGGDEKANYYISGNVQDQTGTVIENEYTSYNLKINSDLNITDWLLIGESINFSHSDEIPLSNQQGDRLFKQVFRALPMIPVYDETNIAGGGFGYAPFEAQWNGANPVAVLKQYDGFRKNNQLFANVHVELQPFKSLKWRTNLSGRYFWANNEDLVLPQVHGTNQDLRNQYRYELVENSNQSLNSFLTFNKDFGRHSLTLMQGMEAESLSSSWMWSHVFELKSTDVLDTDITDDPESLATEMDKGYGAEYGYFGRLIYDFDDKYLLQANYRYDYSAKFGPDYSAGFFPSFSLGWRISQEQSMQGYAWLNDLKIRGGWGLSGIDNIGQYQYIQYYTARGYQDFGGSLLQGMHLSRIPNYTIKWEEIEQLNFGVDFSFLGNKIYGSVDYYDKTTTDMLIPIDIPTQTGFGNFLGNRGEVKNNGFDFSLNYQNTFNELFFRLSATANYNKNEVIETYGTEETPNILTSSSDFFTISRTEEGHPLAAFYGYVADGIINSQEQLDILNSGASDGFYQSAQTKPGDILFKDIASIDENGNIVMTPDGQVTEVDQTFIGSPWPDWFYGLNLTLEYKNFDFNMFWTGQLGNEIFNETRVWTDQMYGDANTSINVLDAWSEENPDGSVPRLTSNDQNENFKKPSSYFVEDGSYLRLKNLQLGYTLPKTLTNRVQVQSMRIYFSGLNLLTLTDYSGVDPEFVTSSIGNRIQGVDRVDNYPQYRSYTVGIQLEF